MKTPNATQNAIEINWITCSHIKYVVRNNYTHNLWKFDEDTILIKNAFQLCMKIPKNAIKSSGVSGLIVTSFEKKNIWHVRII